MPALIVDKGPDLGRFYPLAKGTNLVGRSPGLAVHLQDLTVSRRHFRICWDDTAAKFMVEDLNSTHGVRVNGIWLCEPVEITEGDSLKAGSMQFMFTTRDVTDWDEAIAILEDRRGKLATLNFTASAVREMEAGGGDDAVSGAARFQRWAGAEVATLAIVFTDVVASTEMTSELGNETMEHKRRAHFARVRTLVRENDGYEVKSNGDGFMLAFHAAVKAVDCAVGLCRDPGERSLRVRAGVHIGPVVVREEDVQGAAVSYAARVAGQPQRGGLWISSEVKNHLDQEKAARHAGLVFDLRRGVELKGFPGAQDLWELRTGMEQL